MPDAATILVIDDNPLVRHVVQGMLNAAGFHAFAAEDGTTALATYAAQPTDAAIIDVDMPDMNGVDVCRALRAQASAMGRSFRAWMMTGVVRPDLLERARDAGAGGVLAKPFTRQELLACFAGLPIQATPHALAS